MLGAVAVAVIAWLAVRAGGGGGGRGGADEPRFGQVGSDAQGGRGAEGRRAERARSRHEDGGVVRDRDEEIADLALKQRGPVERSMEEFVPEPGEYDPGPGRDYVDRYQGRSGALPPGLVPGQADVTTRVESPGAAPLLSAWVPTIRVQAGRPAAIHAALVDGRGVPVEDAEVVVSIGRPGRQAEVMVAMPRVEGGDHQYQHVFTTPTQRPADADPNAPLAYDYLVQAVGTFGGQPFQRVVTGSFGVHTPPGAIDPASLRVERDGTDLVLRFTAVVERDAAFWGYAELWGGDDARVPIAFARDQLPALTAGRHDVVLRFGGQIIRDTGADGPFVVRNVKWMQVDAVPPQETEPIPELPPTPAWRASDFE